MAVESFMELKGYSVVVVFGVVEIGRILHGVERGSCPG
ncbi:hypothetical protein Mcup_1088 [Metallosphaera cuprina Ar-4]|uniref:Uncharacterized protein n=1 Tax=Metallosphaera cuprina (strain Ar-4) TaxID=1006006 RepID=F4G2Z5_METCR|nr:hypothetical protein Mcup_1088 [Metallosphaera cuprina Ar-4]